MLVMSSARGEGGRHGEVSHVLTRLLLRHHFGLGHDRHLAPLVPVHFVSLGFPSDSVHSPTGFPLGPFLQSTRVGFCCL